MKKHLHLVYDLPTRVFHWAFAGLFLTGFLIAKLIDSESPWFNYHSLAGLTLGFLVLLRVVWGFTGTKHARFSGFALNPKDLVGYFKGILLNDKRRWAGHNPASSWAGLSMMCLALGLAITGYLMTSGAGKEDFEDLHELLANAFIIVVGFHILGIAVHTLRHREMIGLSMIDGKKVAISAEQTIPSARSATGVLMIALLVAFALYLNVNFNRQTGVLRFLGATLQLSDNEARNDN